ncbi:MAG: glycosyltransferase family 4 protein [Desulfobacula sp.]|nr:glycosyltransferase family 4 protein [Desulfobacula sp.]
MKIIVFTSLFPNHENLDFGIFIKNRLFSFAQLEGCEIRVVAPVPYSPPLRFLGKWYSYSKIAKKEIIEGMTVYHPRFPLIPKVSMQLHGFSMFFSTIRLIRKIQKEFPFDLIDAHYIYPDGFAGMLLGKIFRKPVVVTARGSDINQFSKFMTIRPMIRKTLKNCQYVLSVCNALKDVMVDLGANPGKTRVIPNGIHIEKFYPENKNESRKLFSLHENKKIIFSVGSLIPRKGHHLVIDAMPELIDKMPDIHFFIAGEGEYRKTLEKKISELRLKDHITLLGHIPNSDLRKWYSASDIFCLASSREGWANVIMESMACGTPVVATNVWGAPEIITSQNLGLLVSRDIGSITKGLEKALTKNWDRELIAEHVATRTWEVVAKEVKDVFNTVLS